MLCAGMSEEVEEEAAAEVNSILAELVPDMPDAPWHVAAAAAPAAAATAAPASGAADEAADEGDLTLAALQARADAL